MSLRRPVDSFLHMVLLLALILPAPSRAQNSPEPATTFTSNTELVLIPVQVLDHFGRPLHGLKRQDFVLKSDGNPQRIASFDEIQIRPVTHVHAPEIPRLLAAVAPSAPAITATKYTNLRSAEIPQQLFIIAIDTLNTPLLLQSWARDQVIKYLQSNPPRQPIEVVAITVDGLRQVHEFTTDSAALVESVRKMPGNFGRQDTRDALLSKMDVNGRIDSYSSLVSQRQQQQERSTSSHFNDGLATLRAFEQLAWAYSGIPGRKTVLWLTSGFPLIQEVPSAPSIFGRPSGTHLSGELLPEFQRAFTAMNKANVMVYPVDVNGLPLQDMWDVSQPAGLYVHPELAQLAPPLLADTAAENRDGMKELAHRTGGKSCTAGNTLNYCLSQALVESSDYYLLGFYVSQAQRKIGWHKVKVNVNVDHGEVRARATYFLHALGASPEREQEEDLRSAMFAGINYTGILFSVEPAAQPRTAASPIVFKVSVPASSILLVPGQEQLSFDVIAVPLSRKGTPVSKESRIVKLNIAPNSTAKALAKGWNLINSVAGGSSTAAVKVVIRDNETGRIGSVVFPVNGGTGS